MFKINQKMVYSAKDLNYSKKQKRKYEATWKSNQTIKLIQLSKKKGFFNIQRFSEKSSLETKTWKWIVGLYKKKNTLIFGVATFGSN